MSHPSEVGWPEMTRRLCVAIIATGAGKAPPFTLGMAHEPSGLTAVLETDEGIFLAFCPGDFDAFERRVGIVDEAGALELVGDFLQSPAGKSSLQRMKRSAQAAADVRLRGTRKGFMGKLCKSITPAMDLNEGAGVARFIRLLEERVATDVGALPAFPPEAEAALLSKYGIN